MVVMLHEEEIRFIDLFGGVGGFRLGLERASSRFRCVWYCDNDKYAVQTYNKNFKEDFKPTDIRDVKVESIPSFDMLCAGFPCQSFSIAGKRKGFEDTRGTLFFEICRIAEYHRPKLLFLENVKGLLNHDNGKTFRTILQSLDQLGYDAEWEVLNSKNFGVPQNRERVFIVGHLRGESWREVFPIGEADGINIIEGQELSEQVSNTLRTNYSKGFSNETYVLEGEEKLMVADFRNDEPKIDVKGMLTENGWDKRYEEIRRVYGTEGNVILPTIPTAQGGGVMTKIVVPVLTPDRENKRQHRRRFKEDGEPSFTLTGQDIHGVAIMNTLTEATGNRAGSSKEFLRSVANIQKSTGQIRRLTPTECERLQGFPDGWTNSVNDTQRYKQMGNAVTVNVIEAIGRKILHINGSNLAKR